LVGEHLKKLFPFKTKWAEPGYVEMLELLEKWFAGKKKILDLGCGRGEAVHYLKQKKFNIKGIEIRKFAAWKELTGKFEVFDGTNIKEKDNTFDAILLNNVLEHVSHKKEFSDEIKRVLKPNGVVVFILPTFIYKLRNLLLLPKFCIGWLRGYGNGKDYWFVHGVEVYRNNYLKEMCDFARWDKIVGTYFNIDEKKVMLNRKEVLFLTHPK